MEWKKRVRYIVQCAATLLIAEFLLCGWQLGWRLWVHWLPPSVAAPLQEADTVWPPITGQQQSPVWPRNPPLPRPPPPLIIFTAWKGSSLPTAQALTSYLLCTLPNLDPNIWSMPIWHKYQFVQRKIPWEYCETEKPFFLCGHIWPGWECQRWRASHVRHMTKALWGAIELRAVLVLPEAPRTKRTLLTPHFLPGLQSVLISKKSRRIVWVYI